MKINTIFKNASFFLKLASMDAREAAKILEISPSSSKEEIKDAYKRKVLEWHPDKNKSPDAENQVKLINQAYSVMKEMAHSPSGRVEVPKPTTKMKEVSPDISYEDIAEIRKEMGREKFDEEFPGLTSELKSEMGLDKYNKLFEGYDPNYNPEDDPDVSRREEAILEAATDEIYGFFDFTNLEENLPVMSREDKLRLLDLRNEDYQVAKQELEKLGAKIYFDENQPVTKDSVISKLGDRRFKRMLNEVLASKLNDIIKSHSDEFSELVSLDDILKDPPKYFIILDKGIHFSRRQILNTVYTNEFMEFINQKMKSEYGDRTYLPKHWDLNGQTEKKINSILLSLLTDYYQSMGYDRCKTAYEFNEIFAKLKKFNEMEYEHLVELANPVNYIKK